jgi:hypothetical protein
MKKTIKFFALAIVGLAFTVSTFAQATATATASSTATIVTPIAITKDVDMNFGNIAVSASVAGTVTLVPDGTNSRNLTGGITLPAVIGAVATAQFTVTGEAAYAYGITLPASALLKKVSAPDMVVDGFTCTPIVTGGILDGAGQEVIFVGATLHVAAGQTAGVYTTAVPFPVMVNYN